MGTVIKKCGGVHNSSEEVLVSKPGAWPVILEKKTVVIPCVSEFQDNEYKGKDMRVMNTLGKSDKAADRCVCTVYGKEHYIKDTNTVVDKKGKK